MNWRDDDDTCNLINSKLAALFKEFEAGNCYIGDWGEELIRSFADDLLEEFIGEG